MSTVWIMRADMPPHEAKKGGHDKSMCGRCPLRDPCYVNVWEAPLRIYNTYAEGHYKRVRLDDFRNALIRWGGYGDPAVLPEELVRACNERARGWTGYTHLYNKPWAAWARGIFMASVETLAQEKRLRAKGWGTFRAGLGDGSDRGRTELCAYKRSKTLCIMCMRCDGSPRAIYVPAHGARAAGVPAERLRRKQSRRLEVAQ